MMEIIESKMIFGPYENSAVFHIEKSQMYEAMSNIKTVEFVLFRDKSLAFFEAKSSSPRPGGTNTENFDEFVVEITQKFIHSFNLYYSAILGRRKDPLLSSVFQKIDNSLVSIKLILVIRGHKIEWLAPIKAALEEKLRYHSKIWSSEVIVMNDDLAKQYHFIRDVVI